MHVRLFTETSHPKLDFVIIGSATSGQFFNFSSLAFLCANTILNHKKFILPPRGTVTQELLENRFIGSENPIAFGLQTMEPVSLGFATLSLPGQIFSTSVMAYTTISQIQGMGRMFGRYYTQFKIQESRYIFWGTYHKACSSGGLNPSQMPHIIFDRIVHTLIQINSLLEDRNSLVSKYGLREAGPLQVAGGDLVRRESSRQQNEVKRLQKRSSLLRKIQWAVRDEKLFSELVQQLTTLIDGLYECLPVQTGPYVEDYIKAEAVAEMILDTTGKGTVSLETIEPEFLGVEGCDMKAIQRATVVAEQREQYLGERLSPEGQLINLPASYDAQPDLDFTFAVKLPNTAPQLRSWARSKGRHPFHDQGFMVVEWRKYDAQQQSQKEALKIRIQALVKMLKSRPRSDSFRVLDCIGFFEDNTKTQFGVTYRFPNGFNLFREPPPQTLHDIMSIKKPDLPYLGDRFHLAYLLAESVHALHTTGWLHKSICARNILLFPRLTGSSESTSTRPTWLENPYFTGFALARPDDPTETVSLQLTGSLVTEMALYRHPAYKNGARYRTDFDIYSLGVVLMELGTWRIAKYWLPPPEKRTSGFQFREYLLENIVPGLGASMGERYMNVVRKCLLGDFERLSGFREDEFGSAGYKENVRAGLLWEVVSVLRDCRA